MEKETIKITIESTPSIPNLKIITIGGSLDTVTSTQVDEKVWPIIEHEKSNFILNLSNLIYLGSVGLLRLIKFVVSTSDQKKKLKLIKPPKHIYNIFVAAGLVRHFDMYDSVEEALSSF